MSFDGKKVTATPAGTDVPWYLSGTALAIAGLAVAVLMGLLAVWAAFRSTNPRRRLYFYMSSSVPLLSEHASVRGDIEIRYKDSLLSDPHMVTVAVVNHGSRDIPSTSFDQSLPLTAELGVRVVRLVESSSDCPNRAIAAPTARLDSTRLLIGPSLLAARQVIAYTLLVDGEPNFERVVPLVDIPLAEGGPLTRSAEQRSPAQSWSAVALIVTALTAIGALVFSGLSLNAARNQAALAAMQSQFISRYELAIDQLGRKGPANLQARAGGVETLRSLAQDFPRERTRIAEALAGFIRASTPSSAGDAKQCLEKPIESDIQAALEFIGNREPSGAGGAGISLVNVCVPRAGLASASFVDSDLAGVNLAGANLANADLRRANLAGANLSKANLAGANLTDANLIGTDFAGAILDGAIGVPGR